MQAFKTLLTVLWAPARGFAQAVEGRRVILPVAMATCLMIVCNGLAMSRLALEATIITALEKSPKSSDMTPFERQQAIETGVKVGKIGMIASSLFSPAFFWFAVGLGLFVGLAVAGGKPRFGGSLRVAARGMAPALLRAPVLSLPARWRHDSLTAEELGRLLPSNIAAVALEPSQAITPLGGLLAALDLFELWAVVLLVIGMAQVAGVSKLRAGVAVGVLWAGYVAALRVAPLALSMGSAS